VTNTGHAEAYEGGKKFIDNPKDYKVKDPERLSKTIEHKSNLDRNKAIEHSKAGRHGKAEVYKHEQARQYTKQYEKIIEPRVEKMGGKIPKVVKEGTKVLNKIGKYDPKLGRTYTPADAESALAKIGQHGESIESIIKKGSSLVESGQKIKPKSKTTPKENISPKKSTSTDLDDLAKTRKVKSTTKQKSISDVDVPGATKAGETVKGKAGRLLGEYMDGAMVINQADKIRQGVKEGDVTKVAEGIAGEDTAKRTEMEGGKKHVNEMDRLQDARGVEAESMAVGKLKRMGATKDEIEAYRKNYGKSEAREIVQKVKLRGGKDKKPQKSLEFDGPQESSWTAKEQLIDGVDQAGSYGKAILDGVSLGAVSRGDASKKDLSDAESQSDKVFKGTEESMISRLYVELRDRGASEKEAKAALKNYRNDKEGVRKLVVKLKERDPEKAKGSDHKRDGLTVDNVTLEEDDDGAVARIKKAFYDTGKGMKDMLVKPIKFVNDTAKDFSDVANDAMEISGIGSEKNQKELYAGIKNKEFKDQYERKYNGLIKLGATENEAKEALAGKSGSVNKLTKSLHDKKREESRKKAKEIRQKVREELKKKQEKEIKEKSDDIAIVSEDGIETGEGNENKEIKAEEARKRLKTKIAESKKDAKEASERRKKRKEQKDKSYQDMTPKERREALKRNDDDAWEALQKDLLGESANEDAEEKSQTKRDEQLEIPPVRIVTTASFDGDYSAGKFRNIVTTTMTLSFWNVGSQVAGYGGATMKSRSVSSFNGTSTESYCGGTFSGGPNGIIRLYGDCAGSTLQVNGGRSVSGGGMIFSISNPSAFQYWDN